MERDFRANSSGRHPNLRVIRQGNFTEYRYYASPCQSGFGRTLLFDAVVIVIASIFSYQVNCVPFSIVNAAEMI
jgi:hypothetical protein